jgi:hypothetical protein
MNIELKVFSKANDEGYTSGEHFQNLKAPKGVRQKDSLTSIF